MRQDISLPLVAVSDTANFTVEMLRPVPGRRRPRYGTHICAGMAAILILLSLSVLHSRLSSSHFRLGLGLGLGHLPDPTATASSLEHDLLLLDDADNDAFDGGAEDRIDELDNVVEERSRSDETEIIRAVGSDEDELESDDSDLTQNTRSGGYFWDHVLGVKRLSFGKQQERLDDPLSVTAIPDEVHDRSKIAFASDDQPLDEEIRLKLDSIRGIEEALLLKVGSGRRTSPLREGWAQWFEAKGRFLRQDRMFRSSLEPLDPLSHPLLQDPDGPGLTGLTRGDKVMLKAMWKEIEKIPFAGDKIKRAERRTLDLEKKRVPENGGAAVDLKGHREHADGRRWGYYPGLDPHLSFSEFIDKFLESQGCAMSFFMVWNSPPWTYSVRHQRGLESLLHHHRDACVVFFSETLELDFFKDFVKDGFKIAVAMPNLDELLKDTPTHVFASVWFEWRKTNNYPIHYSELIRLAALYKYGGVYLDSDVIVLKPLYSLKNSVGMEDQVDGSSTLNGAVMAFEKHSPFIMECLREFYSTYDDTHLRWNGADLLTRVYHRLSGRIDNTRAQLELKIEPPHFLFPISSQNITRYFDKAVDDTERSHQDILFRRILNESSTFHFWNGLTSALVPEPDSIGERLLNRFCLHCLDVL